MKRGKQLDIDENEDGGEMNGNPYFPPRSRKNSMRGKKSLLSLVSGKPQILLPSMEGSDKNLLSRAHVVTPNMRYPTEIPINAKGEHVPVSLGLIKGTLESANLGELKNIIGYMLAHRMITQPQYFKGLIKLKDKTGGKRILLHELFTKEPPSTLETAFQLLGRVKSVDQREDTFPFKKVERDFRSGSRKSSDFVNIPGDNYGALFAQIGAEDDPSIYIKHPKRTLDGYPEISSEPPYIDLCGKESNDWFARTDHEDQQFPEFTQEIQQRQILANYKSKFCDATEDTIIPFQDRLTSNVAMSDYSPLRPEIREHMLSEGFPAEAFDKIYGSRLTKTKKNRKR